jgi:signal transduction histidine kinase/ActR/RegA family two-component response regulator
MSARPAADLERRLLILAPVGKDAALIAATLGTTVTCVPCPDLEHLVHEAEGGAAALLVAEEALAVEDGSLARLLANQPPWSDLPLMLLTRAGADSATAARATRTLGNVTLLERPVRVAALRSSVMSALRARERQYQTRALLEQRADADERKDQFLATLAHELRNPLAPIRNSLALLRLAREQPSALTAFEIIDRQVNHMVRLVDDLMDVSRITRGKIALQREPLDLGTVIAAAVETSRPLIDEAGHRLEITVPAEELIVDGDPMRLAQVFANLLNNASRYTDPGGRISVTARREGDSAVVRVRDTGVGIPPDAIARIFDMFAQADAHDSRSRTGLGIGLTLARSLVEMHGGSIGAASEGKGRGSAFVVRLPLAVAAAKRLPQATAAAPALRALQRILVVDDNRDSANTLGALLETVGADVRVAYDGPGALDAISSFRPSVVLLDLGMPGMDGYEVARRIRARPDALDMTLIALTGWGDPSDRRRTQLVGFQHHLVKPVDLDTMRMVLRRISSDHKAPAT